MCTSVDRRVGAQPRCDGATIHSRHIDVQKHEMGPKLTNSAECASGAILNPHLDRGAFSPSRR